MTYSESQIAHFCVQTCNVSEKTGYIVVHLIQLTMTRILIFCLGISFLFAAFTPVSAADNTVTPFVPENTTSISAASADASAARPKKKPKKNRKKGKGGCEAYNS